MLKTELEIVTVGTPDIAMLSENEQRIFFETIFARVVWLACVFIAAFVQMETWLRILLIVMGFIPFAVGVVYALRIEQTAGYYECAKCRHKYVPTFKSVLFVMHYGRTRYMRCPKCHKKVLNKD